MDHPTFGRWLKLRRGGLGLTQAQLGAQIGNAVLPLRARWRLPQQTIAAAVGIARRSFLARQPRCVPFYTVGKGDG